MIEIKIKCQPTDSTCGPTSLHAVYNYYGDDISLEDVIAEVATTTNGGTLAPLLGAHALKRGYRCMIHPYNMHMFDPTWFYPEPLTSSQLISKLEKQHDFFDSDVLKETSDAHIAYLKLGGKMHLVDLNKALLSKYFVKKCPILTGVSATYLYKCSREIEDKQGKLQYNDIQGNPVGHFVVLYGYHQNTKSIIVADSMKDNPLSENSYYRVPASHLINAIMLGVLTNDANMLIVEPGK